MSQRTTILRYHLIINKVRNSRPDFDELLDYLEYQSELQEYDFSISKRTLQRDLNDIRSIFKIDIKYNFKLKHYYIEDESRDEEQTQIFEAMDVFNALNVTDSLSSHIHFEQRKPRGTEHLMGLLHAIKNHKVTEFDHRKYFDNPPTERRVDPLGIKEYRSRWYLVARDHKDDRIKTFALDRMSNIHLTRESFTPPADFNLHEFFRYSFGVIVGGNTKPSPVELSFTPFQGHFIKTLPLHASQEILIDNDKEVRIRLHVHATHDFQMDILSLLPEVRVLKPKFLRDEIARKIRKAAEEI
jgi:predicted DNA-binding transcriptional regulator YafY